MEGQVQVIIAPVGLADGGPGGAGGIVAGPADAVCQQVGLQGIGDLKRANLLSFSEIFSRGSSSSPPSSP